MVPGNRRRMNEWATLDFETREAAIAFQWWVFGRHSQLVEVNGITVAVRMWEQKWLDAYRNEFLEEKNAD